MNPLHKEKYILSKDTFGHVTLNQHKPTIERNKRNIKVTAFVQMIVGIIFIASVFILKQTNMFVFTVFAFGLIGVGIHGLKVKYPKYDKQVWESIEKTYNAREYGENWFEVKFFEDHLKYLVGTNGDELMYNEFAQFFESENYFCMHFITGDLIIFNPDCNKEKIKEIVNGYSKTASEAPAAEETVEETTQAVVEE